jgi:hypothetical protein
MQIRTLLQNAPGDTDKREALLKAKERKKEEAMSTEDTERLVTEIEMPSPSIRCPKPQDRSSAFKEFSLRVPVSICA